MCHYLLDVEEGFNCNELFYCNAIGPVKFQSKFLLYCFNIHLMTDSKVLHNCHNCPINIISYKIRVSPFILNKRMNTLVFQFMLAFIADKSHRNFGSSATYLSVSISNDIDCGYWLLTAFNHCISV